MWEPMIFGATNTIWIEKTDFEMPFGLDCCIKWKMKWIEPNCANTFLKFLITTFQLFLIVFKAILSRVFSRRVIVTMPSLDLDLASSQRHCGLKPPCWVGCLMLMLKKWWGMAGRNVETGCKRWPCPTWLSRVWVDRAGDPAQHHSTTGYNALCMYERMWSQTHEQLF